MFDWKKSREQQISDTLDVKQIWSLLQLQKQLKKNMALSICSTQLIEWNSKSS